VKIELSCKGMWIERRRKLVKCSRVQARLSLEKDRLRM